MDAAKNPFTPGAGSQPPELAGRQTILDEAKVCIERLSTGQQARSQILLGLRGVGKTVLLNQFEDMAAEKGLYSAFIEAPESRKFLDQLVPQIRKLILKFDRLAKVKVQINEARIALRNFASVFKVKVGEIELGVDPEPGIADSGDLAVDLTDLLMTTAAAASSAKTGVVLIIDEVQYLTQEELSALIVALHRVSQKRLPLVLFGAGLPQLAALAGEAKSYAERLFDYPQVGALEKLEAQAALSEPVEELGVKFSSGALNKIVRQTKGYPFFLQEWGFQAWNLSAGKTISEDVVPQATKAALARLDRGFFKVRLDRMTPREQDYMRAMAELGAGPHKSGDIAKTLGISVQSAGPIRTSLIEKGMIYSPAHGKTAFTVPMFDAYLKRAILTLDEQPARKRPRRKRVD
jgi:hypothetical protein